MLVIILIQIESTKERISTCSNNFNYKSQAFIQTIHTLIYTDVNKPILAMFETSISNYTHILQNLNKM